MVLPVLYANMAWWYYITCSSSVWCQDQDNYKISMQWYRANFDSLGNRSTNFDETWNIEQRPPTMQNLISIRRRGWSQQIPSCHCQISCLFSSSCTQVALVDRFWQSIHHDIFLPRIWLLEVSLIRQSLYGVKSPKTPILRAWFVWICEYACFKKKFASLDWKCLFSIQTCKI